jgi:hypothetical protein
MYLWCKERKRSKSELVEKHAQLEMKANKKKRGCSLKEFLKVCVQDRYCFLVQIRFAHQKRQLHCESETRKRKKNEFLNL